MNRCLFLFAIVTFGIVNAVDAQVLKLNILSPIVRVFNVQYEQVVKSDASVQLGIFYAGYSKGGTTSNGFGITPEYRFYLSESNAPEGVFIAPFIRYQTLNLHNDVDGSKAKYHTMGGGIILGRQWVFKDKIALDMFFGPSYSSGSIDAESDNQDSFEVDVFEGFGLRAGISLGIKF